MLFGLIVQILLFCMAVFQTARFNPSPDADLSKDMTGMGIGCAIGIANLTQIIMTLVARCSYAGSICAGDYLPDEPDKSVAHLLPYYEKDDGKFLFAVPIVMLCMLPLICCLTLIVLPMIVGWAMMSMLEGWKWTNRLFAQKCQYVKYNKQLNLSVSSASSDWIKAKYFYIFVRNRWI